MQDSISLPKEFWQRSTDLMAAYIEMKKEEFALRWAELDIDRQRVITQASVDKRLWKVMTEKKEQKTS